MAYVSYHCILFWSHNDETAFAEIELRSLPRVGEQVWFQYEDEDDEYVCNYLVEVVSVMHVAETDDEFPYVQLTVVEIERQPPDEEAAEDDEEEDEETERQDLRAERCARNGPVVM